MERPVGVTRDFLGADGNNVWGDIGLSKLDELGVAWEYLEENSAALEPYQVEGRPAILFGAPSVNASTFSGVRNTPLILARFGVGFDAVDLSACTDNDVAVTITPDGARRPVATAALTMILAALQNLVVKDRLVRSGGWDERTNWMGTGLTGRTIGLIGLGSTATDLVNLLEPFETRILAYDPYCEASRAETVGATLTSLYNLAREADVVVVMATLNQETHHLVSASFIGEMKPSAYLINVSRGPIVDEEALVSALENKNIAGAALDVFEQEPLSPLSPLVGLDNVTLSPHSIAWTSEMSLGNGTSAITAILDSLVGQAPHFVVNPEVLTRDAYRDKLAAAAQLATLELGAAAPASA